MGFCYQVLFLMLSKPDEFICLLNPHLHTTPATYTHSPFPHSPTAGSLIAYHTG